MFDCQRVYAQFLMNAVSMLVVRSLWTLLDLQRAKFADENAQSKKYLAQLGSFNSNN